MNSIMGQLEQRRYPRRPQAQMASLPSCSCSRFRCGHSKPRCWLVGTILRPSARAKRQVRGVKESPENNICCLSNRLNMFDSAIESLTRVDSNALFRF